MELIDSNIQFYVTNEENFFVPTSFAEENVNFLLPEESKIKNGMTAQEISRVITDDFIAEVRTQFKEAKRRYRSGKRK